MVDLEKRRVADVLPDRSAETLKKWLIDHPCIEVVSRDRGTEYSKGATEGAPNAEQVSDRRHLLKNLREAIERVLQTKVSFLQVVPVNEEYETNCSGASPPGQDKPAVENEDAANDNIQGFEMRNPTIKIILMPIQ